MIIIYVPGCSSVISKVYQIPHALISNPGENVELRCNHKQTGANYIYWYQQSVMGELQFLGRLFYSEHIMEKDVDKRLSMAGTATSSGLLLISNASVKDSGVYF